MEGTGSYSPLNSFTFSLIRFRLLLNNGKVLKTGIAAFLSVLLCSGSFHFLYLFFVFFLPGISPTIPHLSVTKLPWNRTKYSGCGLIWVSELWGNACLHNDTLVSPGILQVQSIAGEEHAHTYAPPPTHTPIHTHTQILTHFQKLSKSRLPTPSENREQPASCPHIFSKRST